MNTASPRLPESVWIVISAYNERQRIGPVLDGLLTHARSAVVVDDGSDDDTAGEVVKRPVWLVRHAVNLGQGAALQTGIAFALQRGAETIVTFDADGQHSAAEVPAIVERLRAAGVDFALGSRFLGTAQDMPWSRRCVLRLAVLFTRIVSGVALTDAHNGLRAMTRRGAACLRLTMNRMEHASEIIEQIAHSGLQYIEVPVTIRYSAESLAKGQRSSAALRLGMKFLLEKLTR